jgi:hypothetical protein
MPTPEEIRACADAILSKYDDAPVRSFVLTLEDRTHASVFRADRCYALVSQFAKIDPARRGARGGVRPSVRPSRQ